MAQGFKTGGRQKGTPNKITVANREKLQKIFDREINSERFDYALAALSERDYIYVILRLSSFLVPKANADNTAAIIPEEVNAKRRMFRDAPTGEPEEVERARAADPEEAELAKMLYSGEELPKRDCFLHFPIATPEESLRVGKEVDDVTFARLILWNEKNTER